MNLQRIAQIRPAGALTQNMAGLLFFGGHLAAGESLSASAIASGASLVGGIADARFVVLAAACHDHCAGAAERS